MYNTPQRGQVAAGTAAPTLHVGTYRRALLRLIVGNPLFSDAEQLLTNHNAHECQDAARLALWTRNARRVAAERQAAGKPTVPAPTPPAPALPAAAPTLAELADPAYVAANGARPCGYGLTVADAAAGLESLRRATTPAPAPAEQPTTPAEPWATPAQCDEVFALACQLTPYEKADALRRLPQLTEREAAAFIRGLRLRRGPRLRVEAAVAGRPVLLTVAERHYQAARVDYVRDAATGYVLPRYETTYGGPLVRRVWAN